MYRAKKLLCLILTTVLVVQTTVVAMAADQVSEDNDIISDDVSITSNIAEAIALLFVAGNISENNIVYSNAPESTSEIVWNDDVNILDVIPLYGTEEVISAYCVKLQSNGKYAGYVVVSTNLNSALIQEVSMDEVPVFESDIFVEEKNISDSKNLNLIGNDDKISSDKEEQKIYYYGSLQYGTEAVSNSDSSIIMQNFNVVIIRIIL